MQVIPAQVGTHSESKSTNLNRMFFVWLENVAKKNTLIHFVFGFIGLIVESEGVNPSIILRPGIESLDDHVHLCASACICGFSFGCDRRLREDPSASVAKAVYNAGYNLLFTPVNFLPPFQSDVLIVE